jgi:hypothetical protein
MLSLAAASLNSLRSLRSLRSNNATSQTTIRAAREAASPPLLGAPEARRSLPASAFAETLVVVEEEARAHRQSSN